MISVCMATYNGADFIVQQTTSILSQIRSHDELIVSDDASKDSTLFLLEKLGDDRVKIIRNKERVGYSRNFERAIRLASGNIIILTDQDDFWLPNRVTSAVRKLKHCDMVVCNAEVVDVDLVPLGETYFCRRPVKSGFLNNLIKVRYLGCCIAFNRQVLDAVLPFPSKSHLLPHDAWFSLLGEFLFDVQLDCAPRILYRRHVANTSSGGETSKNSLLKKMKFRLYSIAMLIQRALEIRLWRKLFRMKDGLRN